MSPAEGGALGTATLRPLRPDLQIIADIIAPETRVLDVGCGDGALLEFLLRVKRIDGRGIELGQAGVNACVSRGLSVIQGDADKDLSDYPTHAFDYVVLSQTLQATRRPKEVLFELVRIGKHAIVSFVNVGHWRMRLRFLLSGRVPDVGNDGYRWFDTPNIHMCTIRDFVALCAELDLYVERVIFVGRQGATREIRQIGAAANWRGEQAIFMLRRR
jgi:methionine biosynthesis protein MetW